MALAIDASTPAIAVNSSTTIATVTTASFTPPAGALLLVRWCGDSNLGTNPGTPTITDSLGTPLTYTLLNWQSQADTPGVAGQAACWSAVVGSSAAMTVTVTSGTLSGHRASAVHVTVITGQHATPIGAHGKSGSASAAAIAQNFTGTATSSQGFICSTDWDALGTATAGTGCTTTDGGAATIAGQISYEFMRRTSADGTNGGTTTMNVTLPGTSTNLSWVYAEVVPATGGQDIVYTTQYELNLTPLALFEMILEHQRRIQTGIATAPNQTVPALGIISAETFGNPTISTTVTVTANGISTSEVLGTPTLSTTVTVTPAGIPSSGAFGSPTIQQAQSVTASAILSGEAFGSPAIALTVNPAGIPSSERFGSATVSTTITVTPTGIPSQEAFGSPTLQVITAVNATGITSGEAFGNSTISTTYTVNATGIPSAEAFGNVTILQAQSVVASSIPSQEAFGNQSISTTVTVSPTGITSAERLGSPTITLTVTPTGIPSQEAFGSPTLQVITAVNATGISSAERFGNAAVTTTYTINATGIPSSEAFGSPTITNAATIQATGIPSSEAFGKPTITTGSVTVTASGIPSSERFGSAQVSLGALSLQVQASGILTAQAFGNPFVGREITPDITVRVFTEVIVWRADVDVPSIVAIPVLVNRAEPTITNVDPSNLVVET